ncbi:unnamed protein product, partial [Polarella glacialis]
MVRAGMGDASLVLVIPSLWASDIDAEDQGTMLRGLAIMNVYPSTNMRLMLLRSMNKKIAVQLGFMPSRCFSISEQKTSLFALSCAVRGFSTLITLCLMELHPDNLVHAKKELGVEDPWVQEYADGRKFSLRAFMLSAKHEGSTFAQFAGQCIERNILPLA